MVGLNCGVGPAIVLNAIEKMRSLTDRKLSAQPNAGLPARVGGRTVYVSTPEYVGDVMRRCVEVGVRLVGGCCRIGPADIAAIVKAIRRR